MVLVKNENATGLDGIDLDPDVEIPRDILDEIQNWVSNREFDDSDMTDMHRVEGFNGYVVDREHFHGYEDDVKITNEDNLACVKLQKFMNI